MQNCFLDRLDRWTLDVVYEKLMAGTAGLESERVTATHLAEMISQYVLVELAEHPNACWTACGIDHVSDEEIMGVTTFPEDGVAAAFVGALCDLSPWESDEGIELMISHGVSLDEAREIAAAVEVVMGKLGARGQAIIRRLGTTRVAHKGH